MSGGIATTYKGVRFRSRIEARWARFFDELGWTWDYEPFDLNGYIPDFILSLHGPLLVEVKSALTLDQLKPHAVKIKTSGWQHEAIIVGASVPIHGARGGNFNFPLGWMRDMDWGDAGSGGCWEEGHLNLCQGAYVCGEDMKFRPVRDRHIGLMHDVMSFRCRVCGDHDGDHHIVGDVDARSVRAAWDECGNAVQWKPSKSEPRSSWDANWSVKW